MLIRVEVMEGSVKVVSDKSGHEYIHAGGGIKEFRTRYIAFADDGIVQSGDVQPADNALGREDLATRQAEGIAERSSTLKDGNLSTQDSDRPGGGRDLTNPAEGEDASLERQGAVVGNQEGEEPDAAERARLASEDESNTRRRRR